MEARQAGLYVRISSDPGGERLGVQRQRQDCTKKAKALGWNVVGVYEDNDRSASNGKARPAYDRLLADIDTGTIDAVVVWDLDRLHRRPVELETFIDLADKHNVALASVGGDVDLASEHGRLHARMMGAVARYEIDHMRKRLKRGFEQRAEKGEPPKGRRCYGYSQDGTKIVKQEAERIEKMIADLLAGKSLRSIAHDLNRRRILTTMKGKWSSTGVKRLVSNPRLAGIRTYNGEVTVERGKWPAIIDLDTHYAVLATLSREEHRQQGPPRRYLLSGLATCAACGRRLYGKADGPRGRVYECESKHHVKRRADQVDEYVESVVTKRLALPGAADLFAPPDERDKVGKLQAEEARLRERLDGLAATYADGNIDKRQLTTGTKRLNARIERVRSALAATTRAPVLNEIATADDVATAWAALDLDTKRSIIDLLLTVRVHSPGRGARTFDPSTVEVVWKGGVAGT